MTASELLVANLGAALLLLAAAGLLVTRRARLCRSFLAYLLVVTAGSLLATWIPHVFFTQWFWIAKKGIYGIFRGLIALEVVLLTFSEMPRARRRAELLLGLVLAVHLGVALLPKGPADPYLLALGVSAPQQDTASLWLFVAAMLIAMWHRAPVHPFHRGLLLTFTLYLGFETWLLGLLGLAGGSSRSAYLAAYSYVAAINPLAYALTAGFWTWSAWRAEPATSLSPAVASRLQPWAA